MPDSEQTRRCSRPSGLGTISSSGNMSCVPVARRVAASITAWKIGPAPVTPVESRSGLRSKLPTQTPTVTSAVYPIVQLS